MLLLKFKKIKKRIAICKDDALLKIKQRIAIRKDDVFLVSYPRSGNTWVSFLLANLIVDSRSEINFYNVRSYIPNFDRNRYIQPTINEHRLYKSHSKYDPSYPKVIYIARDGRDVYTSYFYYLRGGSNEQQTFSEFLRYAGLYAGRWGDHVTSWLNQLEYSPNFLLIHYEDLIGDCLSQLSLMADFIGVEVTEDKLIKAIELSSYSNMKKSEIEKGRPLKERDHVENFVRKGISGDWKNIFNDSEKEYFKHREGDVLIRLGYETDRNW